MMRWERSHGHVGVNAPSWLTFDVHRPYFDGGVTAVTAISARGPVLAARLYEQRAVTAPRHGMVMPASYRQLLTEESRLTAYRVARPGDLPAELATPDWTRLTQAFTSHRDLDPLDRAGLAQWLVALCLPDAVLDLAPADLSPGDDVPAALVQYARATSLFQREGLSERTVAAYRALVDDPRPTVAHLQALAGWLQQLARHGTDDGQVPALADRARSVYAAITPQMSPFERAIWLARLLLREVTYAERHAGPDEAWRLLAQASDALADAAPGTAAERDVAAEMRRRLIDRRVEIAARRGDDDAHDSALAEGLALDPYCVKIRMQQAQAAQHRGDLHEALACYLRAARLGPFGTAFALLQAAACAAKLGYTEPARVMTERAFRSSPRSAQTHAALIDVCADDEPLAEMVRDAAGGNWYYQMYGAYFNLGTSRSPCMYARIPQIAYDFAVAGHYPRVDLQRVMPPAFRTNVIRESGLAGYAVAHPAELPAALRTPAWDQLCEWVADFAAGDAARQDLTCRVLFRLGFRRLVVELVPPRPLASLATPDEFYLYHWRDIARYADSVAGELMPPQESFDMVDHPDCPLHLRLGVSVFAVVYAARQTTSVPDAVRWRGRAEEFLAEMRGDDGFTEFEKVMLESRFYRGVGFVPFMTGDRAGTIADMDRAEQTARAVPAQTPWQHFLKRENLHACMESRSKEAFALGDVALGHRRTQEFLALDPYDPKSHIELAESLTKQECFGEAALSYLRAARLGPLGTAISYAMAAECFDRAGERTLAEDCFVQALRVDPYAISAARGWRRVAAGDDLAASYAGELEAWGARRLAAR
jgi:tetratricopeptide (TPR) repeat protein